MSVDEAELRAAWGLACGRGREATHVLDALLARHREAHRRYHGLRHVVWVVRHVLELAEHEPVDDLHAVVVAACFHDAVYDPRASDNELASARLASVRLASIGWSDDRRARVAAMITATAHGLDTSLDTGLDTDTAVLLDADLAVLGSDPTAYDAYATGVRAEYAHVDDDAWRSGRAAVLRSFLDRPAIYRTPTAVARWEHRARANLTAELASLRR